MNGDAIAQLLDWMRSRFLGKYRGLVVSNDDPTHRGRLKVKVPAVLDTLEVWALPCVPYAGADVGLYAMPPAEAGVWIEFEGGDLSFPIWVGCFWADNEAPLGGDPAIKVWKTDSITMTLDDDEDTVAIENSSSASLTMTRDVVAQATSARHTVASSGVTSELGSSKVEVTSASVTVTSRLEIG